MCLCKYYCTQGDYIGNFCVAQAALSVGLTDFYILSDVSFNLRYPSILFLPRKRQLATLLAELSSMNVFSEPCMY